MTAVSWIRTWADDVALGVTRATEAKGALASLARDADAVDDITLAVRSGSTWDDPMDAVLELAENGNRGLWDGWSKADASLSILKRAIDKHPGGAGVAELRRAQGAAQRAGVELEDWIRGGAPQPFASLEATVRGHLDQVRALGEQVLRGAI